MYQGAILPCFTCVVLFLLSQVCLILAHFRRSLRPRVLQHSWKLEWPMWHKVLWECLKREGTTPNHSPSRPVCHTVTGKVIRAACSPFHTLHVLFLWSSLSHRLQLWAPHKNPLYSVVHSAPHECKGKNSEVEVIKVKLCKWLWYVQCYWPRWCHMYLCMFQTLCKVRHFQCTSFTFINFQLSAGNLLTHGCNSIQADNAWKHKCALLCVPSVWSQNFALALFVLVLNLTGIPLPKKAKLNHIGQGFKHTSEMNCLLMLPTLPKLYDTTDFDLKCPAWVWRE